jgi:chromosome segregation ATPase
MLKAERDGLRVALAAARGTILDLRSQLADLRALQDFLRLSRAAAETEAFELKQQVGAARAELERREASALTERTRLIAERDAHTARVLEPVVHQVAALTDERDALARPVAAMDRLVRDLRWENGPRSLRVVLPLARLVRRLGGG